MIIESTEWYKERQKKRLITAKQVADNNTITNSIAWHKDCLKNRQKFADEQKAELDEIAARWHDTLAYNAFYAQQIATAEESKIAAFDRDKYMHEVRLNDEPDKLVDKRRSQRVYYNPGLILSHLNEDNAMPQDFVHLTEADSIKNFLREAGVEIDYADSSLNKVTLVNTLLGTRIEVWAECLSQYRVPGLYVMEDCEE